MFLSLIHYRLPSSRTYPHFYFPFSLSPFTILLFPPLQSYPYAINNILQWGDVRYNYIFTYRTCVIVSYRTYKITKSHRWLHLVEELKIEKLKHIHTLSLSLSFHEVKMNVEYVRIDGTQCDVPFFSPFVAYVYAYSQYLYVYIYNVYIGTHTLVQASRARGQYLHITLPFSSLVLYYIYI